MAGVRPLTPRCSIPHAVDSMEYSEPKLLIMRWSGFPRVCWQLRPYGTRHFRSHAYRTDGTCPIGSRVRAKAADGLVVRSQAYAHGACAFVLSNAGGRVWVVRGWLDE